MAYISSLPQLQQKDREGNTITPQSPQGLLPNLGGALPIPEGVDKSFVQGYLAMQQNARENDASAMAASSQAIKEEAFGWMRIDREKKEKIDQGMIMAAREGGYSGVIDFLRVNDPDRALAFEKEKAGLDSSIMQNETYKLAHENDKAKVITEGYSLLGGVGATLMKTPADKQQQAYQSLLPVIKQIDPNMPDQLNMDAVTKLGLGMALSTPANLLYDQSKQVQQAQSAAGKLQADIDMRIARGETTENSAGLVNLLGQSALLNNNAIKSQNELEGLKYDQEARQLTQATNQIDYQNKQQQLIGNIGKNYESKSKGYTDYLNSNMKVQAALEQLGKDPTDTTAQQTLQFSFAKMLAGGGVMSDQDVARTATSTGAMSQAWKNIQNLGSGNKVVLDRQEIENMKGMYGAIQSAYQRRQSEINVFYQNQLDKFNLPRDSIQFYQSAPPEAVKYLLANPTEQNKQYFRQTFGYTPDMSGMGS